MRIMALILLVVAANYGVNAQCPTPTGLSTSSITTSSSIANWNPVSGALSYDVDYKQSSWGFWINIAAGTTSTSWDLFGIPASTSYEWRVKANCSSGSSDYAQTTFSTLPEGGSGACSAPTNLSTSPITATTGTAHWALVSGATSYDVDIKPAGSSSWTPFFIGISGSQCLITQLQPSTSYDWRVRANCSSGSSSYTQTQFTTGPIGSCMPPDGLATIGTTSTTATVAWNPVSGAYGYSVQYKPTTSGTWIIAGNTDLTSRTIFSLSAGTTYDWRVWANCSLSESSSPSYAQFTVSGSTPPPPPTPACPGPSDVGTNGTTSGAAAISLNTEVKGTISPKYDIDYYKFTISSGGTITVSLTTLPANFDLAVFNSSGTQMGISQSAGSKNETISLNVAADTYYAKVFPKGTANNDRSCYTLKVQTGTAARTMAIPTNENVDPNFTINLFPNPAADQLNVWMEGVDRNAKIKVYNLVGKLVMQQQAVNTLTPLNISKLPAGIYMLNVNNGKETKAAKFVKQ